MYIRMYVPRSPRPNKEWGFGMIHGSQGFPILPMGKGEKQSPDEEQ